MIRLLFFPHHQQMHMTTSPLVNQRFPNAEGNYLKNNSGKIFAYFPELPFLNKNLKPKTIKLRYLKGKIEVDDTDILIGSNNILFKLSPHKVRAIFQTITFADIHADMLTPEQYKEVQWEIKPEYILDFINKSLTLNQRMIILETFFWTSDPFLRGRLDLLLSIFPPPEIKSDFSRFSFRDHQARGINFIIKNQEKKLLSIMDYDMGAGKTRMVLSLLYNIQGESVVVLKSSLIDGMIKEAKELKIFKELKIYVITNPETLRSYRKGNAIVSYEMLSRYKGNYKERFWRKVFEYMITDESQVLQSPVSNVFNTAINISATRFAFFSGTPIRNSVSDSYYLAYWLKLFTGGHNLYQEKMNLSFKNRTLYAINKESKFASQVQKAILSATITYKNKFNFKIEEFNLPIKLKDEELKAYKQELEEAYKIVEILKNNKTIKLKDEERPVFSPMDIIAKIPRMIAIASNYRLRDTLYEPKSKSTDIMNPPSKYVALKSILEEFYNERVLIFVALKNIGITYQKMLKKDGFKSYYADGSIDKTVRFKMVDRFNSPNCNKKIFIATRDSMKYGLNFSNTSIIINLDRSWTPADNEQANARIKRLSQKNSKVKIFNIFSVDTIDEYMRNVTHLKGNALKDFWKGSENSYDAINDYQHTHTSLFQMIENLQMGNIPKRAKDKPMRITKEEITYPEIASFFTE